MRNKIALFGIMALLVVLAVPATLAQLDYVNIGDTASEAGHNLYGWGPIEPAEHGGGWGGADDGTIRVAWYCDNGTGANCSVPCQTPDPNGRQANFTMDNPGKNATILQLRVLDGIANDSFDVFIDGSNVYNYIWSGNSNEFWITHNISISAFKDKDPLNITINATGPQWGGWGTYGQLGVSWAKLESCDKPNTFTPVWDNIWDENSTLTNDILDICSADLDKDGKDEIITCDMDGYVTVFENVGNDDYEQVWQAQPESGENILAVAACDMDNDGRGELICGGENETVYVYEWDGTVGSDNYSLMSIHDVGSEISDICCGDIDDDGEQELGIAPSEYDKHPYIYNVSGTFETTATWNIEFDPGEIDYSVHSVLCGCDLNNNSQKEFIFGHWDYDEIYIYESTAPDSYTLRWQQGVSTSDGKPWSMTCCDMDKDGYQELYVGDHNGELIVVTNTGDLTTCSYSLLHDYGYDDVYKLDCCDQDGCDCMNDLYLAIEDGTIRDLEFTGTDVTSWADYTEYIIGNSLNPAGGDAKAVHVRRNCTIGENCENCIDLDKDGLHEVVAGYEHYYYGPAEQKILWVLEYRPCCEQRPYVEITKTVFDPDTGNWEKLIEDASVGETYRFRINITGNCCNFTNVKVNDTLSARLSYSNDATPFEGTPLGGNVYQWSFATLNKDETKTIEFNATIIDNGLGCNFANVTAYCEERGNWSSAKDQACVDTPSPDLTVTSVELNYDVYLLPSDTLIGPEPGPGVRTQCNNISARIKEQKGVDVTKPFNVSFTVNGAEIYSESVPNLDGYDYKYIHCDCGFDAFAGIRYNISVTVDANAEITETNENNNVMWKNRTAIFNGYKGDGWQGPDKNLTNVQCHPQDTINLTYSIGNSYYQDGYYNTWTLYTANWTTSDLTIPAGASIKKARLYVYYVFDRSSGGDVYNNFTVNFNGENITRTTVYTDRKNWGSWDYPAGMVVYNVTEKFNTTGNNVTLYNNETTIPHHVAVKGMLMMVIYNHPEEPERMICIDEGCDILYARRAHGVSSEEATTYASFACCEPLNVEEFEKAKLISIAGDATQQNGAHAISFNGVKWVGTQGNPLFNQMGLTEVYNNETDVKHLLQSTNNTADYQSVITTWGKYGDAGDYYEMFNAFMVLEKPMAAEKSDLVLTDKWMCWPDNCTICYNVTNIGNGTAPAGHNTTLYVDGSETAHDLVPVPLIPNASYTGCFQDYNWIYTPPSDNITICADNNKTVAESNETNNCLTNIWMCGDVRKDGYVTPWDVSVLNRYVAEIEELEIEQKWAGDVNDDGYVTAWDVSVLNRYVAGIDAISCKCQQLP